MRAQYFEDTDTLYIELGKQSPVRTEQVNENVLLEIDGEGKVVGLTIEHIKKADGKLDFTYEAVAA